MRLKDMLLRPRPPTAWVMLGLYATFVTTVSWPIWRHLKASCYAYYDLGIYSQAVALWRPSAPNPWLTGRQIHIFSDHFDPVITLVVPLAQLIGAAPALIVFESACVLAATLPVWALWRKNLLCGRNACAATGLLLFHPCVIYALLWPAHPTTWAIAPMMGLGVAMLMRRYAWAYGFLLALLCCKEEFVYVGLMLAAWLSFHRRLSWAVAVAATTLAWMAWVFVGRVQVWGPIMPYTQQFTQDLWQDPWAALQARWAAPNLPFDVAAAVAVFGALGVWAYRHRLAPAWGVLALGLPLWGIRFIAQTWGFHYNAVSVGLMVAAFLPPLMQRPLPRLLVGWLWVCMAVLDGHAWLEAWPVRPALREQPLSYCPHTPERLTSLRRAFALALADSRPLLAEENLMQQMITHPQIYMFNGPQGLAKTYQAVLFEKAPHGTTWQYTPQMMQALIEGWRHAPGSEILMDDAYVFYARGTFRMPSPEPVETH